MSCSRTPKPPSPDSFQRALGNREKAFRKIYRKSVTGRVREKAMTDQPRANWLRALPAQTISAMSRISRSVFSQPRQGSVMDLP